MFPLKESLKLEGRRIEKIRQRKLISLNLKSNNIL